MEKIPKEETMRRLNKWHADGMIELYDVRKGDVIVVHTEPATYLFTVFNPQTQLVDVASFQDPDFFETQRCIFFGCVWEDQEIESWAKASMKINGCLLKDCYLVLSFNGRATVFPRIYEVEIDGVPFFKTTGAPHLLERLVKP